MRLKKNVLDTFIISFLMVMPITPTIIAKELGDKKYEKVVLATLQNYGPDNTNANKNIFNSCDKMMKIIEHCEDNNITVISHFKDRLPDE